MNTDWSRRRFMAATSAAAVAGLLASCSDADSDDSSSGLANTVPALQKALDN
ncbi:MAG: twin-arginine translocation signal domain-containing protein [Pseudonocardiaceae bacterium]